MMKIKLGSKGYAMIDDEDYSKISHCAWFLYADTHNQYARNKKNQRMHRVILGAKKGDIVDHKDGDGLNNQRSNIRLCTHSQNMSNKKVVKKKDSRHLGVFKQGNRWVAVCGKDKIKHKKILDTEIEAAIAYNEMAVELHGEFARFNTIDMIK